MTILAWLAVTGCATQAKEVVEALAKDPATVCLTVTSVYGVVKAYRTAAVDVDVKCNQDGMAVTSTGATQPKGD